MTLRVGDASFSRDGGVAMVLDPPRRSLPASADDLREWTRRQDFFQRIDRYLRDARACPDIVATAPGNGYTVTTGTSATALSAATAKTLWYLNSPAADQPHIVEFAVGFDGVTSTNTPALVELVFGDKTSNSTPGTGSTTATPAQIRNWFAMTAATAAGINCSSEPTVLTQIKQWLVTPFGGLLVIQAPLGRETTAKASGAAASGIQVGLRTTAPQVVNARSYVEFEE